MTDPEREHFLTRVRDLERSRARWRRVALLLGGVILLPVVCGGLLGIAWVPRLERERIMRDEVERAIEAERAAAEARLQAEQAVQEAERQKELAEGGKKETARQKP